MIKTTNCEKSMQIKKKKRHSFIMGSEKDGLMMMYPLTK